MKTNIPNYILPIAAISHHVKPTKKYIYDLQILLMWKSGYSWSTSMRHCDLSAHGIHFPTIPFSTTLLLCEKILGSCIISLRLTHSVGLWVLALSLWWCPWDLLCGEKQFASSPLHSHNKHLQTICQPLWAPGRCWNKGLGLIKLGFEFVYQLFNTHVLFTWQ